MVSEERKNRRLIHFTFGCLSIIVTIISFVFFKYRQVLIFGGALPENLQASFLKNLDTRIENRINTKIQELNTLQDEVQQELASIENLIKTGIQNNESIKNIEALVQRMENIETDINTKFKAQNDYNNLQTKNLKEEFDSIKNDIGRIENFLNELTTTLAQN